MAKEFHGSQLREHRADGAFKARSKPIKCDDPDCPDPWGGVIQSRPERKRPDKNPKRIRGEHFGMPGKVFCLACYKRIRYRVIIARRGKVARPRPDIAARRRAESR